MPIIPRYQARGGPSVGGLNYAGAFSPPDGSDWRTLARTAEAANSVLAALSQRPAAASSPKAPPSPADPDQGFAEVGLRPDGGSPQAMSNIVRDQLARYGKAIKDNGIKGD